MKYSLERILHNIYRQKLSYLVILMEFGLGVSVFLICMNYLFTAKSLLRECKESTAGQEVKIVCYLNELQESYHGIESQTIVTEDMFQEYPVEFDIAWETYQSVYETYSEDLEILFSYHVVSECFLKEGYSGFVVYYMNDELFQYLYGFEREEDCIYLGAKAYEALRQRTLETQEYGEESLPYFGILKENRILLDGDYAVFEDGSRRKVQVVSPLDENQTVIEKVLFEDLEDTDTRTDMADVLILPLEEICSLPDVTYMDSSYCVQNDLVVHYRSADSRDDAVTGLIMDLTIANPSRMFMADNTYLELKNQLDSMKYDTYSWVVMSVSMILLSGIGCIGFMFIQMNKRRHTMSVDIAYGSTYRRLIIENLLEVGSVFVAGGFLGIVFSPRFRGLLLYPGELRHSISIELVIAGMIAAFTVLSVVLGMHAVRKKDVMKSLREE